MAIKWSFISNQGGEIKGINDSGVATFRGTPLKSLAREICQNSLDAFVDDSSSGIPRSTTLSTREHSLFSLLLFKHCLKFKIPNILSHPYPLPLVESRSYDKVINSREMRKSLVFSASILGGMFCLPLSLSLHKNLCRQSSKAK